MKINNKHFNKYIKKKFLIKKSLKIIFLDKNIIYINKKLKKITNINYTFNKKKNKKNINIIILKNKNINTPIHFITINNINKKKNKYYINILIEKNINSYIIEEHYSIKNNKFINYNTNITINKKSNIKYFQIININKNTSFTSKNNIKIKKFSKLKKIIFLIKAKNILIKNKTILRKKSKIKLYSLSIIKKKKNYTYKTKIKHNSCCSISKQKHKNLIISPGIINFIGKIIISSKANFSKAILENNNLCINKPIYIYSKPQLNIFNQNSKSKHNVKIYYPNKKKIFYLLNRGFNNYESNKILYIIFIKEIINKINLKNLKKKIKKIIYKNI